MSRFLASIMPFIMLGVIVVLFFFALVFLSYVWIIGTLVGLVFFSIATVINYFRGKPKPPGTRRGRLIEHDDDFSG